VVIIVAALVVALLSHQSATKELTRFINENLQDEAPDSLIADLADYYSQQGDWAGVDQVLGQISLADEDKEGDFPMLLVDYQGNVIATNWMHLSTNQFPEQEISLVWSIQVNGETVGTLISPGRMPGPPPPCNQTALAPKKKRLSSESNRRS
jgi:hypothetical protein